MNFTKHWSWLEGGVTKTLGPSPTKATLTETSHLTHLSYTSQIIGHQRKKCLQYFLHLSDFADTGLNARLLVAKQFLFVLFFQITPSWFSFVNNWLSCFHVSSSSVRALGPRPSCLLVSGPSFSKACTHPSSTDSSVCKHPEVTLIPKTVYFPKFCPLALLLQPFNCSGLWPTT